MKKSIYTQPTIYVEDVVVENGIAASPFGGDGDPGQGSGFIGGEDGDDDFIVL